MVYSPRFITSLKRVYAPTAVAVAAITVFVSIVYADSVPVVGFNNQPSQTSETAVTIDVHVNDTESDDVAIAIRYSLDDGGTWFAAQQLSFASFPIVGNEVTEIPTYGDGPNNRSNVGFFWNFLEEPGIESSDTVRIEVTPRDISGEGNAIVSSAFSIVAPSAPVFADESGEVTDITKTSALVHYSMSEVGSAELTDFELQYSSAAYFLVNASYDEFDSITYSGAFSLSGATEVNGLLCDTTYHFVQTFTNGDGRSVTSNDATFTTSVCDEDLKFYWPLDEGAGTATGVSSGYPGTLYGGVSWISGGGISLDGINDYVRTNATLTESMGVSDQAYTLSASVRVNDSNETGNIVHISNNGSGIGWCIAMLHIEDGYFRAIGWDGGAVTAVNAVPAVLGEWYSIANTWSPETNTLDLYVNGALVASTPMTTYQAAEVPVYVFAGIDAPGCSENQGWFKGDVKDVRIYSRAITQEEVVENANASLGTISASFSPEDDEDGVSITSDLELTFSTSTVATSSGTIGLYRTADDSLVEEFPADSDRIAIVEDLVVIDPSDDLDWATGYYVYIPDTVFVDALGNTYPGTVSSSTWNFSTQAEPEEVDLGEDNDIADETIFEMLAQYFSEIEDMMWTSVSASADGSRLVAVGTGWPEEGGESEEGTAAFIYTSENGGVDWQLSTSTPTTLITSVTSSADGNSIIAVGIAATEVMNELDFIVMKSTDQGVSWNTQIIQTTDMEDFEDQFVMFMAFYLSRITASSDLSRIYISLYDNVYYSDNGGADWEIILPLGMVADNFAFPLSISTSANGAKVLVSISPLFGNNPEMIVALLSEDYGETWNPVLTGEDEVIPFYVAVSKDGGEIICD